METLTVVVIVVAVGVAAALAAVEVTRRRLAAAPASRPADESLRDAVALALVELRAQSAAERDAAVHAAIEQAAVLGREQLGAVAQQARQQSVDELGAKQQVIDSRLDQVRVEMRTELEKLSAMVAGLAEQSAQRFGQVDQSLRSHAEVTHALSQSAQALREAMASPTARGQWGERMAEDVLRLAGFVENVNYVKQTQLEGAAGRPDFTFPLPKGHELYMDVKFPMAGYLRFLDATTDAERHAQRASFLRDVRARVRELARRDYARESARQSVDYVLMFLPNEQLTGFIHESDPGLIDEAMGQRVVMCSPLTLFAFLGVIRQAYDNFVIEQTSDQILALMGKFGMQWVKYNEQLTGFIHESDPGLIDEAMGQRVVMCSPLTLFAFLGVIRQAYDNFVIEQTSDQILALMGKFGMQWVKYNEQLEKVHAKFTQLDRQFDELMGPRRRQLEKPLQQLDAVRRERNLAIDGQLFTELPALAAGEDDEADDDLTPDNIHRLGA